MLDDKRPCLKIHRRLARRFSILIITHSNVFDERSNDDDIFPRRRYRSLSSMHSFPYRKLNDVTFSSNRRTPDAPLATLRRLFRLKIQIRYVPLHSRRPGCSPVINFTPRFSLQHCQSTVMSTKEYNTFSFIFFFFFLSDTVEFNCQVLRSARDLAFRGVHFSGVFVKYAALHYVIVVGDESSHLD